MRIEYNARTKKYRCHDKQGNWYPQADSHYQAIQYAISNLIYWQSVFNNELTPL